MSILFAAIVCLATTNTPPAQPVVTEPSFDGRIVNPEDAHMETGPFSDPDPGNTHTQSDWEIWTVTPSQRVWAALAVTGPERIHVHLGDGVFQGSHAGRLSLLTSTNYMLRVRHRDSSGEPGTEWSPYGTRLFATGTLSSVFAMELDDIQDTPVPTWVDSTSLPIVLPIGAVLRLESAQSEPLLTITGTAAGNQINNPPSLVEHVPIRVRVSAAAAGLPIPESDLAFTDHTGVDRTILLPAMNVSAGQTAYFWVSANGSTYHAQAAQTEPDFSLLARGASVPWNVRQPGFKVEIVASGFQLPVNIAFVSNPGIKPQSPLFYVSELYGSIKVVRRNGTVGTYVAGLLNFTPTGLFPGSGEQGLAGVAIDPITGDLFGSMLYDPPPVGGDHYPKIVRFHSNDGGQTAATQTTIRDMVGETQGQSHQVSNLSIGPDGKLYVHMGDGFDAATAQNLDSYRGKVLRMNLDGSAPSDNPFYNAGNGISARDYVFAYGLRNPFGGGWRLADGKHYEVENGPAVDRMARIDSGRNYLWNGSDQSMTNFAIYNWNIATGPVNIAFIQTGTFGGSQFPAAKMDHAFVTESGPTWGTGPHDFGKRISEFVIDINGNLVSGPTPLIEYDGSGKASCVGLAAGPDGLYFTDLYKDLNAVTPTEAGANVLRVRFVGAANFSTNVTTGQPPLSVQFTDLSTVSAPTSWQWTFGDGASSTQQHPTHVYTQEGLYTVRLAVTVPAGTAVIQRPGYIGVGNVAKLALIGGSNPPVSSDEEVGHFLSQAGFIVDHFDDDPANRPTAQQLAASHDLVIVSSTVGSGNIGAEFRTAGVPLVFWESALLRTDREALASSGVVVTGQGTINIVNTTHPITQGLAAGNLTVFQPTANMTVGTGTIAAAATVLARRGATNDVALMVAEQGAALLSGYIAPDRRAFVFLEDASFLSATAQAQQLIKRAACWAGRFDPVITMQPAPVSISAGLGASFSVVVGGAGPASYAWRRNGIVLINDGRISGATSRILTINPVVLADAGVYDVLISAPCGGLTSSGATLAVSCYANCDASSAVPLLTANDFQCFVNRFVIADPYANCDGSTTFPVFNANDFQCFINSFALGCS